MFLAQLIIRQIDLFGHLKISQISLSDLQGSFALQKQLRTIF